MSAKPPCLVGAWRPREAATRAAFDHLVHREKELLAMLAEDGGAMKDGTPATTVPQSETVNAPGSTIKKDSAWLGGKDEASLGNATRTLYNLGISKDEWTNADKAGRKALLERHIYGQGWGSDSWREATGVVSDFYRSKADAIRKERQDFRETFASTVASHFGAQFMEGWTAKQRRDLAERYMLPNNIGGIADRYKTIGPGGAASKTALRENERKAAMWGNASTGKDPAALWAKRRKRIDEIHKIRGW